MGFLEDCEEGRRISLSFSNPLIVHHIDADGISSGAIVEYALRKQGKKVKRKAVKKIDEKIVEGLGQQKELIFTDLGNTKLMDEFKDVVIIDHHQPVTKCFQVNGMKHGIDGAREISSATTAYCVFKEKPELAVVGSVGDMQYPLKGMNREVAKKEEIRITRDVRIYGRTSRPLIQFLMYADDPMFPGLYENEKGTTEFLQDMGIELKNGTWRTYSDLTEKEKVMLVSGLVELLLDKGYKADVIGEVYVLKNRRKELSDAHDFSTIVNACGRNGDPTLGVEVCLDDRYYEKAFVILNAYKKILKNGLVFAKSSVVDFEKFLFLDGRKRIGETVIGVVCGMYLPPTSRKPILGISLDEEGNIKASARANTYLIKRGLNLGVIMRKCAESVGGIGGGHTIAAGASFSKERMNEFLICFGEMVTV